MLYVCISLCVHWCLCMCVCVVSVVLFVFCSFLQYFDTVGWVFWPVKTVSRITYTVLEGTLNTAQSNPAPTQYRLYVVTITTSWYKENTSYHILNCFSYLKPLLRVWISSITSTALVCLKCSLHFAHVCCRFLTDVLGSRMLPPAPQF